MRKYLFVLSIISVAFTQAQEYTLKQLGDSLLAKNYAIRLIRIEEEIAKENNTSGASGALPSASLIAGQSNAFNNTRQEFFNGDVREANNAANQSLNFGLRVDWTLFNGFKVLAIKDQLATQERLAQLNTLSAIEEQLYQLTSIYFELNSRIKIVESLRASVKVSADNYKLAQTRQIIGKSSKQEVLQSLGLLHADSSALLLQENRIRFLELELKKLSGIEADSFVRLVDYSMTELALDPLPDLINSSLSQNLEIKRQKSLLLTSHSNLKNQKSELYPRLGVFGEYNFVQSSNQVGILKSNRSLGPAFGLGLSYNLFDGFRVSRNINIAKWEVERQNLSLEKVEYELRFAIIQVYQDYLTRKQLASFEKENVLIANQNLELAQAQLKNGVINSYEFREVQQEVLAAQSREIDASYQLNLSLLQLKLLSGSLIKTLF